MSHVLQTILAAVLRPPQDNDMVFAGLNSEIDVLATLKIRISYLKSLQVGPHGLSHRVL